jgi:hypothetical protein
VNEFDNFVATSTSPRDTHPGAPHLSYIILGLHLHLHLSNIRYENSSSFTCCSLYYGVTQQYHLYMYIRPLQLPCQRKRDDALDFVEALFAVEVLTITHRCTPMVIDDYELPFYVLWYLRLFLWLCMRCCDIVSYYDWMRCVLWLWMRLLWCNWWDYGFKYCYVIVCEMFYVKICCAI